ncbi:MAG: STAS domain-containing protein [Acidimicrobiia bacterium]|nr:STAS domain-containing protein [Acidimicrobiia bacterium]
MPHPGPTDGSFVVKVDDEGGRPVVRVRGELDVATSPQFAACVDTALSIGAPLTIDLAEATFMDSTGLSTLIRAHHASGRVKEAIVLRSPCAAVRRTLEVSGVADVFTIEP